MKARDLAELATRNLRESMLRNSLTTLGIGVGIASLVAMLSLGIGLQELAGRRLSRSGLFDTVVVYSRRDIPGFSRAERRANPATSENRPLDGSAREDLARLPHVVEVYPEIRFTTEVRFAERGHFTVVAGLPMSSRENDAFDTLKGRYFSGDEADEVILQTEFARTLDPAPEKLLGQDLVLRYAERRPLDADDNGSAQSRGDAADHGDAGGWGFSVVRREKNLRIIGIVEDEPYGGMRSFARGRMFVPNGLAEKLNAIQASGLRDAIRGSERGPTYTSLLVRVSSPGSVQGVQDAIKKMGFTTWSVLDATRNLRRFFAIVDIFLGIFGSLAVAVASLGIVNTLVMAILERRREIGIMKALGASDADVKRLFFAEAGVMGLVGGALGVALGWAMGRVINFGTNIYLQRQELPPEQIWSVPWWLVGGAIGFAIFVSLVSGLYPAARAARLDPVQALRYE
jgi:putative ABC transport system permease protein